MTKAGVVAPINLIVLHVILQFFMTEAGVVAPINIIVFTLSSVVPLRSPAFLQFFMAKAGVVAPINLLIFTLSSDFIVFLGLSVISTCP